MYKQLYERLLNEIANKPSGTFPNILLDLRAYPIFQKLVSVKGNKTFKFILPENATEQDYKEYCILLCDFVGKDINKYIKGDQFTNFGKDTH